MARAVGIDLGTTNSVVAVLEGGRAHCHPHPRSPSTPCRCFRQERQVLVGEVARQAVTNVDRTIRSVKRHMGTNWSVDIDGKKRRPSGRDHARILMKLKRDAEAYLGESVTNAATTVPAYFGDAERQATKEAGEIAARRSTASSTSPPAARPTALDTAESEHTVLVFDLGGGTFDVPLCSTSPTACSRSRPPRATTAWVATTGISGRNDWLVTQFKNANGIDLSKDKMARQRLQEAAERAKIEFFQRPRPRSTCRTSRRAPRARCTWTRKLTRAEFQRMTSDLLDRCRSPFNAVIKDANTSIDKIDQVILVGGSTRMPAVADLVKRCSPAARSPTRAPTA